MRCRKHLADYSSSVGVCASCLRDKLIIIIQNQSQSQTQPETDHPEPKKPETNTIPNPKQQPPPPQPQLNFPRSVSPYTSRRPIQRFHSTPQVDPTSKPTKKPSKFSLFTKLFRSRSVKSNPDPNFSSGSVTLSTTSSNTSFIYHNNVVPRGMSPDYDVAEREREKYHPTVKASPARQGGQTGRRENAIALCLSPLVRASPVTRHHWSNHSNDKVGYSGEIRVPGKGSGGCKFGSGNSNNNNDNNSNKLMSAGSFCKNRSRKLADFGRLDRNR